MDIKKNLVDDTDIEVINDLRILCNVFQNNFINSGVFKEYNDVIFNPKFGIASMCCGGADADLFMDGTLYDFNALRVMDTVGLNVLKSLDIIYLT